MRPLRIDLGLIMLAGAIALASVILANTVLSTALFIARSW